MKRVLLILFLAVATVAAAQPHYASVLRDVEAGSPLLRAAQRHCEAEKSAVYVGALLPDPEVEGTYFWGSPASVGRRWDLSATQSFEMPSVVARRVRLRKIEEQAAEGDYRVVRSQLLYEAQQLCADIVCCRAVADICAARLAAAARLAEAYTKRMAAGDCSILDYNRAQLSLAEARQANQAAALSLAESLRQLSLLTGRENYEFGQTEYEAVTLPATFADWYVEREAHSPELQRLELGVETARQELSLSRSLRLPEMAVGYASENTVGESFHGVKVGLSLPLWSRRRAVSQAQLEAEAAQAEYDAQRRQVAVRMESLFNRVASLSQQWSSLCDSFMQLNSLPLLDKALEAGEITLEQYLQQADCYYGLQLDIWSLARDREQAWLQLNSIML